MICLDYEYSYAAYPELKKQVIFPIISGTPHRHASVALGIMIYYYEYLKIPLSRGNAINLF
jgi:hypothetical protein